MKLIVAVVLALVAVACAIDEPIPILRSDFQQQPNGPYEFGLIIKEHEVDALKSGLNFEAGNGIIRQETGELKDALDEDNKPHPVITVRGSYTYPDENGKPLVITYSADENGYHAEGDAIPKLPARR